MSAVAFKDYLKKFSDVLTKKYKKVKSNDLVVKSSDGEGMKIESTIKNVNGGKKAPEGSVKVTYEKCGYTLEASTNCSSVTSGKVEGKPVKGLKVALTGTGVPAAKYDDKTKTNVAAEATYTYDSLLKSTVKVTKYCQPESTAPKVDAYAATQVDAAVSAGQDGISVGGCVTAKNEGEGFKAGAYKVGANYSKGPLVIGLVTKKFADLFTGFFYKCNGKTSVGVSATVGGADKETKARALGLGVGVSHNFNKATVVQAKVDVTSSTAADATRAYAYGGVVEYNVPDFAGTLQLTSTVDAKASKFGVCYTYGDK